MSLKTKLVGGFSLDIIVETTILCDSNKRYGVTNRFNSSWATIVQMGIEINVDDGKRVIMDSLGGHEEVVVEVRVLESNNNLWIGKLKFLGLSFN